MADTLDQIQAPIANEMKVFEKTFRGAMASNVPLLDRVMTYIVKHKGKQMRPMFVLLSAAMHGEISEKTYRGASLVELMHTATLIHDDVVDDAFQRRGFFSVNALWKNKIAVLVGDFLLSQGLLLSLGNDDFKLLKILSEAVKAMSEGELLQIEKSRSLNTNEDVYFDIITKKTASLISSCCAIGAASNGANDEELEKMRLFGEKIGIAFQIKDDLFDFGTDDVGKPVGIDLQEKKLTLPLIYALKQCEAKERSKMIKLVKNYRNQKSELIEVVDFVRAKGGIAYAEQKMSIYKSEALALLDYYPESTYKTSLIKLVDYTIDRKK